MAPFFPAPVFYFCPDALKVLIVVFSVPRGRQRPADIPDLPGQCGVRGYRLHDPFSPDYPGFVIIEAEIHLPDSRAVFQKLDESQRRGAAKGKIVGILPRLPGQLCQGGSRKRVISARLCFPDSFAVSVSGEGDTFAFSSANTDYLLFVA